jgi:hypothetical protein
MTSIRYIITAEFLHHVPDGLNPNDGTEVTKTVDGRRTWSVSADDKFGDIMRKVERTNPYRVTITEDSAESLPY